MNRNNLHKLLPTVSINKALSTVTFDSMPLWTGVQKTPGIRQVLPFVLTAILDGPIRQTTSAQIIKDIVSAYQSDEYTFITPPPGASEWANSFGQSYVEIVITAIGNCSPRNILEIGGGSAWIASRLRERYSPTSYVIVDPSVRDSAEGVDIILDYFPNQQLVDRYFDLVLGFNVLEHVPDPLSFLCSIHRQLTSTGKVILIYPDCENQLLRGDLNVLIHEHINYFTEASSRWLAAAAGFNVLSLSSENDTFTLVLEADSGRLDANRKLNEFQLIQSSAEAFRHQLTNADYAIRKYLDSDQYVGFHGATAGLNTFLFITGLGDHPNIRIYDGDESKEGLYLPACLTPILSSMDKSYTENALLVISAMTFFEQIKQFAVERPGFDPSRLLPLAGSLY